MAPIGVKVVARETGVCSEWVAFQEMGEGRK